MKSPLNLYATVLALVLIVVGLAEFLLRLVLILLIFPLSMFFFVLFIFEEPDAFMNLLSPITWKVAREVIDR